MNTALSQSWPQTRRRAAAGFAWLFAAAGAALAARTLAPQSPEAAAWAALALAFAGLPMAAGVAGGAVAAWAAGLLAVGLLGGWSGAPALLALLLPLAGAADGRGRAILAGAGVAGFVAGALFAPAPGALAGLAAALGAAGAACSAMVWDMVWDRAGRARPEAAPVTGPAPEDPAAAARARFAARAADLGHELRTPIGQMVSFAETVAFFGPVTERQQDSLAMIQRAGAAALAVTERLLNAALIEGGRYPFTPEPMDARALCEDAVAFARLTAERRAITLALAPGGPAPVTADVVAVRQILQNLIGNALKFTPEGGRAEVRLARERGALVIAVEDSGPGIPEAERARLTERFARGRAAAGGVDGVGLGLSLVAAFAGLHGGSVRIESSPGLGGARVAVILPAED